MFGNPKAVRLSQNSKIGDAAATYAPVGLTCGDCPLRGNGCYAEHGNVGMIQRRVNRGAQSPGTPEESARMEAAAIDAIDRPLPIPLRIHVSGDATSDREAEMISGAAKRYRERGGRSAWSYTHQWRTVGRGSWGDVSVLASCETFPDVIRARRRGYGAAIVVDDHPADGKAWLHSTGVTVVPCPSQTRGTLCVDCGLCLNADQVLDRGQAIAFAAHGGAARKAKHTLRVVRGEP